MSDKTKRLLEEARIINATKIYKPASPSLCDCGAVAVLAEHIDRHTVKFYCAVCAAKAKR